LPFRATAGLRGGRLARVDDPKADLRHYLQLARDGLLWKLDGLSEYDARRPLTPTGTNLLGLVKHLAGVEVGYLGTCFGRPADEPLLRYDDATVKSDPTVDMWATADQTREEIIALYLRACAHADMTVEALPLDAHGRIPHSPAERSGITLHRALVHMIAETQRHLGHADIVRELVDGATGHSADNPNTPAGDRGFWAAHRNRVERAAREAGR
jgi:Protein of unknown function (DUF664)